MTSHWSPAALEALARTPLPAAPVIAPGPRPLAGLDLWDYWPVQEEDGRVATLAGGVLYVFLAAPAAGDPDERHGFAHLRLVHRGAGGWRDLGPVFADGAAPGSRQWSGSATVAPDRSALTLFFTAAGHRGEERRGYDQRLFVSRAALVDGDALRLGAWSAPTEIVTADGVVYLRDMTGGGALGTIKAFRDPYFFRDPADGADYLLFTASLAASTSAWNGAVGVARRVAGRWQLEPPLIAADGVNNELERPHIVVRDGRYYCFWSTQAKVFAPGIVAPTGLYGMVADRLRGAWRPLNGTGLVIANPAAHPHQAYSWLVLDDLSVISFVDLPGLAEAPADAVAARAHFGGYPAPELRLRLDGDRATLV